MVSATARSIGCCGSPREGGGVRKSSQGRSGVSQTKEKRGRGRHSSRGSSKGRGENGFVWPHVGKRKFDGEGTAKEGRD